MELCNPPFEEGKSVPPVEEARALCPAFDDQLCNGDLASAVSTPVGDELIEFESVPADVRSSTLAAARKQRCSTSLRSKDPVALAREEVHTSGAHGFKIRSPKKTAKHKPTTQRSKQDRADVIRERRLRAERAKSGFRAAYEGLLNAECTVKVDPEVPESFGNMFERVLRNLKSAINGNRLSVEHILKIDSEGLSRLLFAIGVVAVSAIAVVRFDDMPSYLKFIMMGVSVVAATWSCSKLIHELFLKYVMKSVTGFDVEMKQMQAKADYASVHKEFTEWANKDLNPKAMPLTPDEVCQAMEDTWASAPSSLRSLPSYEGIFEVGGGTALFAFTEICAGAVSLITGSLFTGGTKNLGEKLVKHQRTSNDLKVLFGDAMKWIAAKVDLIFGTSFSDHFRRNVAVEQWSEDVQTYYNKYAAGEVKMSATLGRRVNALMLRGLELARKYENMDASSWALHRFCTQLINKMEASIGAAGIALSERPVPLVVVLRGESGIGKSYIQHGLIDEIALRTMATKEDREEYVRNHTNEKYMWVSEEEHANGYFGQYAVIFDDFGQFLTQKGQQDDYIRIIRLANAAPCRLNCAELERKGRVVFTSPLIVCSTNLYQYWGPSLAKPEALVRRFDVTVNMVPRPEFCVEGTADGPLTKRRLDRKKITKKIDYNVCEYHLLKCTDADQQVWNLDRVCNFEELVDHCVAEFKVHKDNHSGLMDALAERREEVHAMMSEQETAVSELTGEPVVKYEGLMEWLKPKKSPLAVIGDTFTKLRKDMRLAMFAMKQKHGDIRWLRFVGAVLMILALAVGLSALISMIAGKFSGEKQERFTDPGAFFTRTLFRTYKDLGFPGKCPDDVHGWVKAIGLKKVSSHLKVMRRCIEEKGHVAHRGCKLVCSLEKMNEFINSLASARYEADLLEREPDRVLFGNRLMGSILNRNVYHMYREGEEPELKASSGKMTIVRSNIGMMNAHYLSAFKEMAKRDSTAMLVLCKHDKIDCRFHIPFSLFLDENKYVVDAERDIALVQLPESVRVHRDILKHFVSKEVIQNNRDCDVCLYAPRSPHYLHVFDAGSRLSSDAITVDKNIHTNVVRYKADTSLGDCGSLLAYSGDYPNPSERIVGMHMAGKVIGGDKHGYATVVTRDILEGMLAKFGKVPRIEADVHVEGNFLKEHDVCHEVVKKLAQPVFQPTKTAIVASALYGCIGPVTKRPAQLRAEVKDGKRIDPMVNAHLRQHTYNKPIDEDLLELVVQDVTEHLSPFVKNRGMILDFEQAVVGGGTLKNLGPIPRKTSAGFTYRDDPRVKSGKKEIFGAEGEYDLETVLCRELRTKVLRLEELAAEGIVPEDRVYTDILKDENLPHAKVDIGKTRMIAACDLPMTVLYRKYYGALCNDLVGTRIINGIAVGINPYSAEWHFVVRYLMSVGYRFIAGDFSSYDLSQSCQLIRATMRVLNTLTGHNSERAKTIMEVLAVTLAQPYHASGGVIYELDHGMPSGNPMTSIVNSVFGLIAFRLCWLRCAHGRFVSPGLALKAFNNNVRLLMYGDDNLLCVSDEAISFYNQNSMMSAFPDFGLKYTSDKKEDTSPPPFRAISQVTFLKRGFALNQHLMRYVAPLDAETIISMLHWTKRGGSSRSITLDNCRNALREWALHGEEVYNRYGPELQAVVEREMGERIFVPTYAAALHEVCNFVPEWIKERH